MRTKEVRAGMVCRFLPRRVDVKRIADRYNTRCVVTQARPLKIRFDDGVEWGIHPRSIALAKGVAGEGE